MPNSNFDRDIVMKPGTSLKTGTGTDIVTVAADGTPSVKANIQDSLASGKIYVGSSAGVTSEVTVSGDVALSNTGVATVTDLTIASEARGDLLRRGASTWERVSAKDSGKFLIGDGTDVISATMSGDASVDAAGAVTVADVTLGSDAAGDLHYKSSATAMARLAKGTAGQYLQMNSGATAPEWVSLSGDATLANGVVTVADLTLGSDAAGDMFYKTSATVTARLPKGTANQMLHMNSGATAPEWASPLAGLVESTSATATADGLTTGAIGALTGLKKFVAVTSANATDAITLPGISAGTVGQEIFLTVGANGYELLTVASSNVTINQVDSDGTNQLDVAANTTVRCTQISGTAWLAETIAATTIAITAPDND